MRTTTIKEDNKLQPVFARHETFHPRFGWLKKGFDRAIENPMCFSEETAAVSLGVGKNMVKAIRYWCLAYKILQEDTANKNRALIPTPFGQYLLKNDGWDPYLEDLGSLWLLHWHLLKSPSLAPAWYYTYNIFNHLVFKSEDLLNGLREYKDYAFPLSKVITSSLFKDISCLLRMYAEQRATDGPREDSIDSPFAELGLIKLYEEAGAYAMNVGHKPGLAPEIIVAACLDFASSHSEGAKTISIARLLYDEGSPGLCFKIKESSLCDAIESISKDFSDVALSETAGLNQLSYNKDPHKLFDKILNHYYRRRG